MGVGRAEVEKALSKPSPFGLDVDVLKYVVEEPSVEELKALELEEPVRSASTRLGFNGVKPSYVQVDQTALYKLLERRLRGYGVIVAPLRTALEKMDYAKRIAWRLVDPRSDKYTALAYLRGGELGYFIYVPPNVKVDVPIYTCLVLRLERRAQLAHNIVYVDEGSEAHVITGCAVPHGVRDGLHVGISEFHVSRGARLTFSMIHAWSQGVHVRPRTAVYVEEGGEYVGYYITYNPVQSIQAYPVVRLQARARAYSASVVVGLGSGDYDVGTKVILEGPGASGEIVSRTLGLEESRVTARAEIVGKARDSRGHIECLGLLVSEKSSIAAYPLIRSEDPGSTLSHEAAIGRISREELEYLMSRGFEEDEAKSIIVRGFMKVDVPGLPEVVRRHVDSIVGTISKLAVG